METSDEKYSMNDSTGLELTSLSSVLRQAGVTGRWTETHVEQRVTVYSRQSIQSQYFLVLTEMCL